MTAAINLAVPEKYFFHLNHTLGHVLEFLIWESVVNASTEK